MKQRENREETEQNSMRTDEYETEKRKKELHQFISELESKMTDLYLDSKVCKQSCITDFFKKHP